MDEIVYKALCDYYHVLCLKGYMSISQSMKLLILSFYKDFISYDYRGLIKREDYCFIEKALDCLYGTSCLIPYPDYLKMGKLHLGEMSEMAQRIKTLEDTSVVKVLQDASTEDSSKSDVLVVIEDE